MQFIQIAENDILKRRVYLHLVDITDGITPVTGESGTARISINGKAPTTSVNPITEISSTEQPGTYYLELSTTEIKDQGFVTVRYKSVNTAEFVDVIQVLAFDPFTQFGQFGGGGADVDYKRIQKMIDEAVAKIVIPEAKEPEKFDYETLAKGFESVISRVEGKEIPETDLRPVLSQLQALQSKIEAIKIPETDLKPLMERVDTAISITEDLLTESKEENSELGKEIKASVAKDTEAIKKSVSEVSEKLQDIQYVVIEKPKEQKPKKSVIEEYLNLK